MSENGVLVGRITIAPRTLSELGCLKMPQVGYLEVAAGADQLSSLTEVSVENCRWVVGVIVT